VNDGHRGGNFSSKESDRPGDKALCAKYEIATKGALSVIK
jgi:hypothetical protein